MGLHTLLLLLLLRISASAAASRPPLDTLGIPPQGSILFFFSPPDLPVSLFLGA
jgi:hypothetical protein